MLVSSSLLDKILLDSYLVSSQRWVAKLFLLHYDKQRLLVWHI